jgi:hypothetical protein
MHYLLRYRNQEWLGTSEVRRARPQSPAYLDPLTAMAACGDNRNFPFSWIYLNIFQSQVGAEHFLWWGRASRRKALEQEPEKTATQQTERERDMSDRFNHISDKLNFAQEEENILEFWKEIDAFNLTLKLSEGRPEFTFYDGPPFATGLPHYGFVPFPPIFPFPPLKVC